MTRRDFNMSVADSFVAGKAKFEAIIPKTIFHNDIEVMEGKLRRIDLHKEIAKAEKFSLSEDAAAIVISKSQRIVETEEDAIKFFSGVRLPFPTMWVETPMVSTKGNYQGKWKDAALMGEEDGLIWMVNIQMNPMVGTMPLPHIGIFRLNDAKLIPVPLNDTKECRKFYEEQERERGLADMADDYANFLFFASAIADQHTSIIGNAVQPSGRFYSKGKFRPYFSHRVVSINLDAPKYRAVDHMGDAVGTPKRAHKVRGHWRHYKKKNEKRVFIENHVRGDSSLGWICHDYDVHREDET